MSLEQTLDRLLANDLGVKPEEVNGDLLLQKRKELYESDPQFKETKEMCSRADAFLDQYSKQKKAAD